MADDKLGMSTEESPDVNIDVTPRKRMTYGVSDSPPIYLTFFFAFQQCLIVLPWNLTMAILVSEFICAGQDETLKAKLLSTTMFLSGACSFMQVLLGVRLPVYQGPTIVYVVPLLTMMSLDEWKCPDLNNIGTGVNGTGISPAEFREEEIYPRIRLLAGSLMLAGAIHMMVGFSGIVGIFLKFVGPITITPTIFLTGMTVYKTVVKFCEPSWPVAIATAVIGIALQLYLKNYKLPIPIWIRKRGWHTMRLPVYQMFSLLLSIIFGWGLCGILTVAGAFPTDKRSKGFLARTDSRTDVIYEFPWFTFPYPGQFGDIGFNGGVFAGFMVASIVSILDSVADYYAYARVTNAPPPPVHAMNRGIGIEGFFTMMAGSYGAAHATSSYGIIAGAIGVTEVGSRHVCAGLGIFLVVFSVLGKVGASFITVPYPVLGGVQISGFGIFLGLVLANVQYIDMQSTRNLAIIGISLLCGLVIPHWVTTTPDGINTGSTRVDSMIKMLMGNPNLVGGALACFLDNTVPGSEEERGMLAWNTEGNTSVDSKVKIEFDETLDIYEIPFIPKKVRNISCFKHIPFFPTYQRKDFSCGSRKQKKEKNEQE